LINKDTALQNIFQYKPLPFKGIAPRLGAGKKKRFSNAVVLWCVVVVVVVVCISDIHFKHPKTAPKNSTQKQS